MKHILREQYKNNILAAKDNHKITVITGVYGAGKTSLIYEFADDLFEADPSAHIIFIDFTLNAFEDLKNPEALYEHVASQRKKDGVNLFIAEEIQLCPNFQETIEKLYKEGNMKIFLSTSISISSSLEKMDVEPQDLEEIVVYPFSFKEYCDASDDFDDKDVLFEWYMNKGGLPGSYSIFDEHERIQYINRLYLSIIGYSLNERNHVQDGRALEKIQKILIDNLSKPVSPNKVSDNLKARGMSANHVTTGKYIKYLQDSQVFYSLKRLDIKTDTVLETMQKYYLSDISFIARSLVKCNPTFTQLGENLVFIELLRRGYQVFTGKIYQKEIDFVASRDGEKVYIQILPSIKDEKEIKEAIKPLIQLRDAYPKILISRTRKPEYNIDGVRIIDIAEWLCGEVIY